MSSIATSPLTTVAAIKVADYILGKDREWSPSSEDQRRWLEHTFNPGVQDLMHVPEIITNATREIAYHIAFLKKHGWQAQINEPLTDGAIATAAVLDVLVEWPKTGKRSAIRVEGHPQMYDAFELKEQPEGNSVLIFEHQTLERCVCEIRTKTSDTIYLMNAPRIPKDVPGLLDTIDELLDRKHYMPTDCKTVIIPKVNLACKQSLDWLPGLHTIGNDGLPATIAQAVQQAMLKMNEFGARALAADEMRVRRGMSAPVDQLILDEPFLFAIKRPNITKPIFAACCDYDCWKDPGNLAR